MLTVSDGFKVMRVESRFFEKTERNNTNPDGPALVLGTKHSRRGAGVQQEVITNTLDGYTEQHQLNTKKHPTGRDPD